jgi:hypothetical protein
MVRIPGWDWERGPLRLALTALQGSHLAPPAFPRRLRDTQLMFDEIIVPRSVPPLRILLFFRARHSPGVLAQPLREAVSCD